MLGTLVDRLVVALDPSPSTAPLVRRRVVELADALARETTFPTCVELLGEVVTAAEHPTSIGATELAARAGVTYRQINYWTSRGWIVPLPSSGGSGTPLAYPPETIRKARVMGAIVRLFAIPPERASELADEIVTSGSARVGEFTLKRDPR